MAEGGAKVWRRAISVGAGTGAGGGLEGCAPPRVWRRDIRLPLQAVLCSWEGSAGGGKGSRGTADEGQGECAGGSGSTHSLCSSRGLCASSPLHPCLMPTHLS